MNESGRRGGSPPETYTPKDKAIAITAIVLMIAFILVFVAAAVFFLTTGTFYLLGIEYDSWQSVLAFIGIGFVFDLVLGFLILCLITCCTLIFPSAPKWQVAGLTLLLHFTFDLLSLHYTDEWMDGVTFGSGAEVAFVALMLAIDGLIPDSKKKGRTEDGASDAPV
ncbi:MULTISPECIES: regulatory YrvL family protein [Paenibacillus]|uniref:regulatory YrvL family protein n=1 Tax=Paenibacillus TaxID=44249 RepID=UPI0022B8D013|nr:regulatory YrvL family protein [Paenibacillus caseinilyticus]MCZ8518482.1 regulatory YrvL family protein [Paenibacillus caseinilyticus]